MELLKYIQFNHNSMPSSCTRTAGNSLVVVVVVVVVKMIRILMEGVVVGLEMVVMVNVRRIQWVALMLCFCLFVSMYV